MRTLIKNEYYKLFHKKSIYIVLFIIFLFVILTNIIYKKTNNSSNNNYDNYSTIYELEEEIKNFNQNKRNTFEFVTLKTDFAEYKFQEKNKIEWQNNFYNEYVRNYVFQYYEKIWIDNDVKTANIIKQKIINLENKLKNNDWAYFVNLKITDLTKNIADLKMSLNLPDQELQKDITFKEINYIKKLYEYRLKNNIAYDNYLSDALINLEYLINGKLIYENSTNKKQKDATKGDYRDFMINEYIVKNNVDINNSTTLRAVIKNFFNEYLFLILVFVIMISGTIISEEFNKGTIKNLLIIPYTRSKIFFAKFITVLTMIPLITFIILIFELTIGGIMFGFSSLTISIVDYNFKVNMIKTMNLGQYFILNFSALLPEIILLTTLAFSLSTIICNAAASITITLCGYIGSGIINLFIQAKKLPILNYFVTPNWDLTYLLFGGKSPYNINVCQSIIICLIYFILMIGISLKVFKRKNIKNI